MVGRVVPNAPVGRENAQTARIQSTATSNAALWGQSALPALPRQRKSRPHPVSKQGDV